MPITNKNLRALLISAFLAAFLLVPASANAAWTVKGGGFGHGIGMNAYGAYGMAKAGKNYRQILRHYYRHTEIRKLKADRKVRVLLSIDSGNVLFSGVGRACGRKLTQKRTYAAKLRGRRILLIRPNGKRLANCGAKLRSETNGKVVFRGLGRYRGGVVVVPSDSPGSLNVINAVSVNEYIKGVIPNESIPSWPIEALRAQALAARGIALTGGVGGKGFDLYNDTRSQVYKDVSTEYRRTTRAADSTTDEIVTYRKKPALTVFSASSGGHTENVENVWFGDPVAYLQGVRDPWDDVSPYHRWTYDFSNSAIASALGVKGRLKRVKITQYGVSKRVIWARFYGTGGITKVRGDTLQYALGLPDRLIFSIRKASPSRAAISSLDADASGPGALFRQTGPRPGVRPPGIGTTAPSTVPSTAPAATSDG